MNTLETIWWIGFWAAVGLCLGSFLNVVIYRLPLGRSLRSPLWSSCPACGSRIRWYDNLPIASYLMLRGRCRDCRAAISPRYLVVEALCGIVVLLLLDAFFVGGVRAGLSRSPFGLTERLAYDWPIFLAHIVLFACLLSMSAIDLEHYWVDIRFTNFATVSGLVLHALWTPRHSADWPRPWESTGVVSLLALCGLLMTWLVIVCQPYEDPEDFGDNGEALLRDEDAHGAPTHDEVVQSAAFAERGPGKWSGGLFVAVLVGMVVALILAGLPSLAIPFDGRALVPLAVIYALIVREGMTKREADEQIVAAIHEERFTARRMVLEELVLLLPAVALGLFGCWLMTRGGPPATQLGDALHQRITVGGASLLRHWEPLWGLATAASGFVLAGALGWAVRIGFTLFFGREAFGAGDVHLMAAAGCVAGWPVVLLGLFLTCFLALSGWLIALPFKRSRAIPLGPWLSLALLIVVLYYDRIIGTPYMSMAISNIEYLLFGNSQLVPAAP